MSFGTAIAGEIYHLECSVNVTGSSNQPNITWLDPTYDTVPSEMVNATSGISTLVFNPLVVTHAGTYTCQATLGGVVVDNTNTVEVNCKFLYCIHVQQ